MLVLAEDGMGADFLDRRVLVLAALDWALRFLECIDASIKSNKTIIRYSA